MPPALPDGDMAADDDAPDTVAEVPKVALIREPTDTSVEFTGGRFRERYERGGLLGIGGMGEVRAVAFQVGGFPGLRYAEGRHAVEATHSIEAGPKHPPLRGCGRRLERVGKNRGLKTRSVPGARRHGLSVSQPLK